nr:hypothetical protein ABW20_dc0108651 [Dactylellina cionopaga]
MASGTGFTLTEHRGGGNALLQLNFSGWVEDKHGNLKFSWVDLMDLPEIRDKAFTGPVAADKIEIQPQRTKDPFIISYLPKDSSILTTLDINLQEQLANDNGQLKIRKPDDTAFTKDGYITQFVEGLPFFGYAVAFFHDRAGHDARAERAIAKCTYATMVSVTASLAALTGCAFGVAVATIVATGVGMKIEGILRDRISNANVAGGIDDVTLLRFVREALVNVATGGLLGKFTGSAGVRASSDVIDDMMAKVLKYTEGAGQMLVDQGIDKTAGSIWGSYNQEVAKATMDAMLQIWDNEHPDDKKRDQFKDLLAFDIWFNEGSKEIWENMPDKPLPADFVIPSNAFGRR